MLNMINLQHNNLKKKWILVSFVRTFQTLTLIKNNVYIRLQELNKTYFWTHHCFIVFIPILTASLPSVHHTTISESVLHSPSLRSVCFWLTTWQTQHKTIIYRTPSTNDTVFHVTHYLSPFQEHFCTTEIF